MAVIEKPALGYQIEEGDDGIFELQHQEPAFLRWHTLFYGPTAEHCRLAYQQISEGEQPQALDAMDVPTCRYCGDADRPDAPIIDGWKGFYHAECEDRFQVYYAENH